MAIAEAMRDLTKDIAASYDLRVAGIGEIKKEVKGLQGEAQELVKGFHSSHEEMAAKLREELSKSKGSLKTDVRGMLNDFQTAHKQASAELREELSEAEKNRKSEVEGILRDAQELVKGFHSSHEEMAAKLREELSEAEKNRKSEVEGILRDAQELVKDFSVTRGQASGQLRKELEEHRREIKSETAEILNDARKARGETKADLKEASAAWQGLASTMQQKRAGIKVALKVEEAKVEVSEEEAVAKAEPAAVTPEIAGLKDRVFEYLADHPDGTRMVELEREFDVARIQMARMLKNLMGDNKVEKRDLLYFAI